jgi:predicted O-methyltransferase YrrM
MQPRKLSVLVANYAYGGNGGISMLHPTIAEWLVATVLKMKQDPRIGEIFHRTYSDTPITMSRCRTVLDARECGADLILMIDSDQIPDHALHEGDPYAKPFWESSFDFIYQNYDKGPHVVGAPYCGPSPVNNVYVFRWASQRNAALEQDIQIEPYSRGEAAIKVGMEEVAALPTGLILFDVRVFELTEPKSKEDPPWFYYEWKTKYADEKCSTEDVTATRDIALAGMSLLGYSPIYVNWDAWAGHIKPEIVGKPNPITTEQVNSKYRDAVLNGASYKERRITIGGRAKAMPTDAIDDELSKLGATVQADLDVLQKLVKSFGECCTSKPTVVEIGTFIGDSAKAMADAGAIVHTIDNYKGTPTDLSGAAYRVHGAQGIKDALIRNIGNRLGNSIFVYNGDSAGSANGWHGDKVDMAFVDANHEYEFVKADSEAWIRHVRVGGIMAGHDYCPAFPGVIQAVQELFGHDSFNVEGTVWWVRVTEEIAQRYAPTANGHAHELMANLPCVGRFNAVDEEQ